MVRGGIKNTATLIGFEYEQMIMKFSVLISPPHAYFLRNWRAITWVFNYSYWAPTWCTRQSGALK